METLVSNNIVATGSSNATSTTTLSRIRGTITTTLANNKVNTGYSSPGSPISPTLTTSPPNSPLIIFGNYHHYQQYHSNFHHDNSQQRLPSPTPVSGVPVHGNQYQHTPASPSFTPIKQQQQQQQNQHHQQQQQSTFYREKKLETPSGELSSLLNETRLAKPLNVIKNQYLVSSHRHHMSAAATAKTPPSYRHLIDLTSSQLRCTDIFTGKVYLCKIINEPFHKVQKAYFQLLKVDEENCQSSIYGHSLIRNAHDIVPLNDCRTYVIVAPPPPPIKMDENSTTTEASIGVDDNLLNERQELRDDNGVDYHFEDLHTYIRNKRRLCEAEARALFHQICQTVQVCHRNGIILRDLKLKRFYFIDEARTKLQYESLEGSMILDNPDDDTLRDKIGCPLYTAPELLCPNATYRGKPADMWSLGVLLYTMLVGQYPFYEKGNCSLITVIRHCQVQIPGMLSRSVRWLLLALLRKNHEERMRAEHILLSPWLREQRPYYMYIPADVRIPTFDNDDDDGDDDTLSEELKLSPEPLDYTCATLQSSSGDNGTIDDDVDMG